MTAGRRHASDVAGREALLHAPDRPDRHLYQRRGAAVVAHADLVIDRMAKVLAGLHAGWPNACAPYHIRLSRNGLLLKICPKLVFGCTKADFCD